MVVWPHMKVSGKSCNSSKLLFFLLIFLALQLLSLLLDHVTKQSLQCSIETAGSLASKLLQLRWKWCFLGLEKYSPLSDIFSALMEFIILFICTYILTVPVIMFFFYLSFLKGYSVWQILLRKKCGIALWVQMIRCIVCVFHALKLNCLCNILSMTCSVLLSNNKENIGSHS